MGSGATDRNSPRLKTCPVRGIWPGSYDVAWDAHMQYQSAWDTVPALAPNSFLAIVHPGRGDRHGLGQLECPAPSVRLLQAWPLWESEDEPEDGRPIFL